MMDIAIFWHKFPDTDCICSSLIFADYLSNKWYNPKVYKLWSLNNETAYLLNMLNIDVPETITTLPPWTRVGIIDHNEKVQTIDNIDELDLEYIIDHHKFSVNTNYPLFIRAEKLCSTASVLYKMYIENSLPITKKIWTLMLSAILSDSLVFRSATTTKEDIIIAEELKEITWINDFKEFMNPLFEAKSDLWEISIEDLIKYDYKEFEVAWKKLGVWSLETVNPSYALSKKDEILKWLEDLKNKSSLEFIMLSIVDIFWENNTTIVLDWVDSKVVEEVFDTKVENNLANLKNRLSRKKQIIPQLTDYFNK